MNRRELLAGGAQLMAAAALSSRAGAANPGDAPLLRKIPASGEELPLIGLGTSRTFEVGESSAERAPLKEVLEGFFAAGARLIDTSPMYGSAEAVLGELMTPDMHRRAFLATKVWTRGARSGIEQMTHSAQLLQSARLDLIQVHNLLDLDTHLKTLHEWQESGRVRYIGVTHYTVSAHAELARVLAREQLDFVQFNYSPVTRDAEKELLPLAAERGVAVLVNRPFEDGALFQAVRGKPLPAWAAELDAASWGQLALKYIAAHPAVTCIIPATGKLAHLQDNLAAGRGRLPGARQRAAIVQAFAP
ncbi:MAG: aldo/keto reductase [Gammaproteobacteria bacterium]|nr:MAG: aldo/keto reductase [Gammaproteobacteria bacterium]TLZ39889.1 MAG: aldo/keto reductase [Gammaproteobacteria bacterium]